MADTTKLKGLSAADDTAEKPQDEAAAKDEAAQRARDEYLRAWPLEAAEKR